VFLHAEYSQSAFIAKGKIMPISDFKEDLFELTVTTQIELSFERTDNQLRAKFLEAISLAISLQPWAADNPEGAADLAAYLVNNSELLDLLNRFPAEVSLGELSLKISELTREYIISNIGDFVSTPTIRPDLSEIDTLAYEDLQNLYFLITGNPEYEASLIGVLESILTGIADTINIGGISVSIESLKKPFLDFLQYMQARQLRFNGLLEQYRARIQNLASQEIPEDEGVRQRRGFFDDLNRWVENGLNDVIDFLTPDVYSDPEVRRFHPHPLTPELFGEEMESLFGENVGQFSEAAFEGYIDIVTKGLITGYNISQIGTNFQQAIINDPAKAFAGVLVGMTTEALGITLIVDIYFYLTEPDLGWGGWRNIIASTQPEFAAGWAIGEFGMGVSQMAVARPATATRPPGFTVHYPGMEQASFATAGSSLGLARNILTVGELNAVVSLPTLQQIQMLSGGSLAIYYSNQDGSNGSSQDPGNSQGNGDDGDEPKVTRTHPSTGGNREVRIGDQLWNVPGNRSIRDIPASDSVGDQLQAAAVEVASEWSDDFLTEAQLGAIRKARDNGDYWWANLLRERYRGSWVGQRVKLRFLDSLEWHSTGPDAYDPGTGIFYDLMKGSDYNIDLHARRMPDILFRMITF
jgi:hypothetical protein